MRSHPHIIHLSFSSKNKQQTTSYYTEDYSRYISSLYVDELFVQTEGEYDIDFFSRKSEVENSRVVQGCMRGINRSVNQSLIVEQ